MDSAPALFEAATAGDLPAITAFLADADLTVSGLETPSLRLWVRRDPAGAIRGTTGFELSGDRRHALIRSVAVDARDRGRGCGRALALFALDRAAEDGARTAWLFSRRSGPFWQSLGFETADRDLLAENLADTSQVRLFVRTGQFEREVAWSRAL
ncbi:GNAT family N-acetyltransferase [Microbacterium sp. HMWF026]|uniref:GNAT family N-acetyltransferase n=1 Tax=Microbacterium sp. HMWF026 TaxID=2056861 RepID=UPI000D358C5C|nr:GNAT family N-acetyltransferase [Microbacterium sp. HMWF026]PTT15953.1 GNAT family N-acetyltransferase [Microbacterium sp. HMWF026]